MMATTVLGKRSRNQSEDVASSQPRKRAARRSAPQIFEDASESESPISRARVQRPIRRSAPKSQKVEDVELRDASVADQDENCPPQFSTPSTTRFKNALSSSPETPKHRVRALGGLLTPRTPRTIDVRSRQQNIYAQARQLFNQSATPSKLIGRDSERQQLREVIKKAKASRQGSCTYISGPPGTGKSALANEVLQEFENDEDVQISVITCVGLRTATQVYDRITDDLLPGAPKRNSETQLRKLFTSKPSNKSYVLVLDEIDSLLDIECETLYNIFEWALHRSSCLTLIGIANALDLTDRFLPRLKSKGLKPELLPFLPYSAQHVSQIISDKLRTLLPKSTTVSADFTPCMQPAAIQLCAKKIASQTGDLRKAFNLVRRTIDQVEKDCIAKEQSGPCLAEVTNSSVKSPAQARLEFTAENAPRANIAHVARLASSIFNNGTVSRLAGLNLQQKAVLCSIVNKERQRQERDPFTTPTKSKAPTIGELFTKYSTLCKRDDGILQPLKDTEFRDVVTSLETLGLVHESNSRSSSLLTPTSSSRSKYSHEKHMASAVSEKEMRDSLIGLGADLLRRLLDEF